MEKIESLQNSRVKQWAALHKKKERDLTGQFLVEGEHLTQEAIHTGAAETILTDCEKYCFEDQNMIQVTPQIMRKLSSNVSEVHLITVCRRIERSAENKHRVLLIDDVQDPGNLGTMIRTAVSFSFDAVYLSEDACDLYNEKTVRSTQGALFHIPVYRGSIYDFMQELRKEKFEIIATSLDKSLSIDEIPVSDRMAFIFGNEGQGVEKKLQDDADKRLRIDMHGFESLNVAVAAGIVMYEYRNL